jgi:hypothetical protein
MRISVDSTLGDLESDLRKVAVNAPRAFRKVVADNTRAGNNLAKALARQSAGSHGKYYYRSFTTTLSNFPSFGLYVGEYGPDSELPQGGMSFEHGSRNQPPHLDLNKSADLTGPTFADQAAEALYGLFWPES